MHLSIDSLFSSAYEKEFIVGKCVTEMEAPESLPSDNHRSTRQLFFWGHFPPGGVTDSAHWHTSFSHSVMCGAVLCQYIEATFIFLKSWSQNLLGHGAL